MLHDHTEGTLQCNYFRCYIVEAGAAACAQYPGGLCLTALNCCLDSSGSGPTLPSTTPSMASGPWGETGHRQHAG